MPSNSPNMNGGESTAFTRLDSRVVIGTHFYRYHWHAGVLFAFLGVPILAFGFVCLLAVFSNFGAGPVFSTFIFLTMGVILCYGAVVNIFGSIAVVDSRLEYRVAGIVVMRYWWEEIEGWTLAKSSAEEQRNALKCLFPEQSFGSYWYFLDPEKPNSLALVARLRSRKQRFVVATNELLIYGFDALVSVFRAKLATKERL